MFKKGGVPTVEKRKKNKDQIKWSPVEVNDGYAHNKKRIQEHLNHMRDQDI